MQKLILSLLFSSFLASSLSSFLVADTLGGEVSIGFFNHSVEGSTSYKDFSSNDTANALGFSNTQDIFFSAALEHPIPLIPNVKLSHVALSHEGNSRGFQQNSLSISYTDTTLYYEVLDNWIEVDVGATLRYIQGEMNIDTPLQNASLAYTHSVPLLYAKGRFIIPSTDLSFQAEINALGFSSVNTYDYALSTRYSFDMGLGIEVGYKLFHIDSEALVEGLESDVDFSGIYTAVSWDY